MCCEARETVVIPPLTGEAAQYRLTKDSLLYIFFLGTCVNLRLKPPMHIALSL